jgi:hypothetical protein
MRLRSNISDCVYIKIVFHLCHFLVLLCSAKVLVKGEPNVAYICSRYYRAPELIFGATDYTSNIGSVCLKICSVYLYMMLQIYLSLEQQLSGNISRDGKVVEHASIARRQC